MTSPPALVTSRCVAAITSTATSQSTIRGSHPACADSSASSSYHSRRDGKRSANDGETYSPRGAGRGSVRESNSARFAVLRAQCAARSSAVAQPGSRRVARRRVPVAAIDVDRGHYAAVGGRDKRHRDVLAHGESFAVFLDEAQRPEIDVVQARQVGKGEAVGVGHGRSGFRRAGQRGFWAPAGAQCCAALAPRGAKGVIIAGIAAPHPAPPTAPTASPAANQWTPSDRILSSFAA